MGAAARQVEWVHAQPAGSDWRAVCDAEYAELAGELLTASEPRHWLTRDSVLDWIERLSFVARWGSLALVLWAFLHAGMVAGTSIGRAEMLWLFTSTTAGAK